MSRFFASSITVDVFARACELFLFIVLLPILLVLTRLPQTDSRARVVPGWPRSARPSTSKPRQRA
jgi:hypothetical protein